MWKKVYKEGIKGIGMFLSVLLCVISLFSQTLQDYRKLLEEALSQQNLAQQRFDVRIERITGTVEVFSITGETAKLLDTYQYPVEVGDTIRTGYDGEANIYINNFAIIHLTRNSEIELTEIEREGIISLMYGTLLAKIEKTKNRFLLKIKTPLALCNVKGTEFAVQHNKLSNESVFGVMDEGEIDVYPGEEENDGNLYRVLKNQEITITPSTKRYKVGSLSKLLRYKSKIASIKKSFMTHKRKWKSFTQQERIKYRERLFSKRSPKKTQMKGVR